jgi:hypothetical protein
MYIFEDYQAGTEPERLITASAKTSNAYVLFKPLHGVE